MVRVSWLLAALLALWLSAPALAQPIRLTDGPPKTVAQQKAEAEALERAQEEAAWKAFEEAEARYKEVRAANADKIEAYDDAIEAWRKANPAPAGTKESLISQSVDYETALEMAAGALSRSRAGIAVSVTGIAGPDGGSAEKPVGLVWFGLALKGVEPVAERRIFENRGRDFIRRETVRTALEMAVKALRTKPV